MATQRLDQLKQRHAYEAWYNRSTLEENLFLWKFFLSGNEFSGWQADRIRPFEAPGRPRSVRSIWQRSGDRTEVLLGVDIFECASRATAHEFLVGFLGEFQSPLVGRQERMAIGDVAFGGPEDTFLLFARANLVCLMRNAGRELTPVAEIARQFDAGLISKPETGDVKVLPEIRRFDSPATEFRVGVSVPLEVVASDPLDRPLWYKFFSRSGEVLLEEGRLTYRPALAGPQTITVFAMNANRGAASRELRLTVK